MKFKLAPSPATNLKQYSERKPKRKEKQRGVYRDTLCARACQAAAESARRKGWGRGLGFREPSPGVRQRAEQLAAGTVLVPSINAATGISHQAGKAQLFTSLRNGERKKNPQGPETVPALSPPGILETKRNKQGAGRSGQI